MLKLRGVGLNNEISRTYGSDVDLPFNCPRNLLVFQFPRRFMTEKDCRLQPVFCRSKTIKLSKCSKKIILVVINNLFTGKILTKLYFTVKLSLSRQQSMI